MVKGNAIKLSCLNKNFQEPPYHATNDVIVPHVRAHILTLIGSLLMPDTVKIYGLKQEGGGELFMKDFRKL